jgi:hypothetical protein
MAADRSVKRTVCLYEHLTCPKKFRLFAKADGAEGHCGGMASTVFWDAAYNWLDHLLAR